MAALLQLVRKTLDGDKHEKGLVSLSDGITSLYAHTETHAYL